MHRIDTVGARRPGRRRALRDHVAGAVRAPLRAGGGGARMRRSTLDARRIDWLITLALALATVDLVAGGRGPAGVRPRRGAVLPGRRALLGLVRGAGGQPRPRRDQAIVHGAGDRSLLERQRPRSPGDHEDAVRPVVARVPSLHLHGRGARPAPDPRQGPPHHAAVVRARIDRVSLPRDPVRGAAGRRWSTGSRAAGCRARRQPRPRC